MLLVIRIRMKIRLAQTMKILHSLHTHPSPALSTSNFLLSQIFLRPTTRRFNPHFSSPNLNSFLLRRSYNSQFRKKPSWRCSSIVSSASSDSKIDGDEQLQSQWNVGVGQPNVPSTYFSAFPKLSLSDRAFFLLAFIACTTSVAFASLVVAAIPTLSAMRKAAISLSKLADTAREELPSTMTAIRLSGMEISDLTLELSDLSQEIAEGVNKSVQVVQAAEAGIRQIGSLARQQTASMIEERANLPDISLQPAVASAAKKTSRAVGHATKTLLNIISRGGDSKNNDDDDDVVDRLEV